MGLDVYFFKEKTISYDEKTKTNTIEKQEVAYFRKNWEIVEYFNLENCEDHEITREELEEFLEYCEQNEPDLDDYYEANKAEGRSVEETNRKLYDLVENWDESADYCIHAWW